MSHSYKIAIIGDYNFTYNSHHATNLALDHAASFLEIDISYYWIKSADILKFRPQQFVQYDGYFVAPGPIKNWFFLHGVIKELYWKSIPTLMTGDCFKSFVDVLINKYQLNPNNEKLISDNLVEGEVFQKIEVVPLTKDFIHLYKNYSKTELASTRYSLYPQLIQLLEDDIVDIDAYNQFEDPEIISSKHHDFFLASGFCPQISSTREIPHPIIYTFLKMCQSAQREENRTA